MYKYLLFDLDGTITNPKLGITNCVMYALDSIGIHEENRDELLSFIGPPLIDEFQRKYGVSPDTAQYLLDKYRERFGEIGWKENELYPDCKEVLAHLKEKGKVICLATSKPEYYAKLILEHFDIAKYFTVVVGAEFDGTRNDKADVIKDVFERLNLTEEDKMHTIMIGDRKHDVIGAKKNGLKTLGIRLGYASEGEMEDAGCEYFAEDLLDLKKFFEDK